MHLRVQPRAATGVARALAARHDTAWVTELSGGTEIVCLFRVPGNGAAPLAMLSEHPGIIEVTAQRLLRLSVNPSRLSTVAASLATDTETAYLGAITGRHNLLAVTISRDADALYSYLSERIGMLPGVDRVETAPVTAYAKRFAPALVSRAG